jgi:hypothetical protein
VRPAASARSDAAPRRAGRCPGRLAATPASCCGEGEVDLVEPLPGLGVHQRQRAQAAAAHEQWHHHRRAQPDRPDEPQVLLVHRRRRRGSASGISGKNAGRPVRLTSMAPRPSRVGRVALLQPGDERDLGRIGCARPPPASTRSPDQVHRAPVGDVRDGEVGESLQALLDRQGASISRLARARNVIRSSWRSAAARAACSAARSRTRSSAWAHRAATASRYSRSSARNGRGSGS